MNSFRVYGGLSGSVSRVQSSLSLSFSACVGQCSHIFIGFLDSQFLCAKFPNWCILLNLWDEKTQIKKNERKPMRSHALACMNMLRSRTKTNTKTKWPYKIKISIGSQFARAYECILGDTHANWTCIIHIDLWLCCWGWWMDIHEAA